MPWLHKISQKGLMTPAELDLSPPWVSELQAVLCGELTERAAENPRALAGLAGPEGWESVRPES